MAAIRLLQGREDIDPQAIGFWGSSEGGMLATYVAARAKDTAFAINSSGFMEPLWKTLQYQVRPALQSSGRPQATIERQADLVDLWIQVARTGRGWETFQQRQREVVATDKTWFFQTRGTYASVEQMQLDWDRILSFDPLPSLANVTCPVLGVFGELDTATPAARAAENMRRVLTQAGHKDFETKIFANAGHSLAELPAKSRMAPGVFPTLRSWVQKRVTVAKTPD